jgi:CRISPR/Cas system-associated endonuclease/helicase Cas3
MEKTYNGWKNYETWLVALWIDKDGSADYWMERANELRYASDLADEIKSYYSGISSKNVSWDEIAEHYIDESEHVQAALDRRDSMECNAI